MTEFAERLSEIRKRWHYSQTDLAKHIGVSRQSIGFYENATRTPDAEFVMKVARHFCVSADWLLGLSDTPTITPDKDDAYRYGWTVGYDCCAADIAAYLRERRTKA